STVDSQCGSSQQATNVASSLVGSGTVDVALARGGEGMSRVPSGSNAKGDFGRPMPKSYFPQYEPTSQFEGAERIADKWGISRADCDQFGLLSQGRGARAWPKGRFDGQIAEVDAPDLGDDGKPRGTTHHVARDEGMRETSLEKLDSLQQVYRE